MSSRERRPASTSCPTATRVKILLIEPRLNFVSGRFATWCSRLASPHARWRRTFPFRATRTTPEKRSAAAASVAAFSIAASASASVMGGGGPARSDASASSMPIPSEERLGRGAERELPPREALPRPLPSRRRAARRAGASTRRTSTPPVSWRIPASRFARAAAGCCRRPSGETAAEKKAASRSSLPEPNASKKAATRLPAAESGKAVRGGSAAPAGPERPRTRMRSVAIERAGCRGRSRMKALLGSRPPDGKAHASR